MEQIIELAATNLDVGLASLMAKLAGLVRWPHCYTKKDSLDDSFTRLQ